MGYFAERDCTGDKRKKEGGVPSERLGTPRNAFMVTQEDSTIILSFLAPDALQEDALVSQSKRKWLVQLPLLLSVCPGRGFYTVPRRLGLLSAEKFLPRYYLACRACLLRTSLSQQYLRTSAPVLPLICLRLSPLLGPRGPESSGVVC